MKLTLNNLCLFLASFFLIIWAFVRNNLLFSEACKIDTDIRPLYFVASIMSLMIFHIFFGIWLTYFKSSQKLTMVAVLALLGYGQAYAPIMVFIYDHVMTWMFEQAQSTPLTPDTFKTVVRFSLSCNIMALLIVIMTMAAGIFIHIIKNVAKEREKLAQQQGGKSNGEESDFST